MIVSGKNVFNELKTNKKNIKKAYLSKNFHDAKIIKFIKENHIQYESVDEARMKALDSANHQGVILIINEYEYFDAMDFLDEDMVVILDHLEDPHNFGAIIRTCESAGIRSIIIPKDRSVGVNPTVVKTSSGAIEYVKIAIASNLVQIINKFKSHGFFVYGTDALGKDYNEIDYSNKVLLVIGSEGKGISRLVKESCDEIISIPMKGNINSLNASVAAGIIIYKIIGK